jgi:hypothetical protein
VSAPPAGLPGHLTVALCPLPAQFWKEAPPPCPGWCLWLWQHTFLAGKSWLPSAFSTALQMGGFIFSSFS